MIIFLSALAFGQEDSDGMADSMAVVTYGDPADVAALIERQHAALQVAAARQATLEAEIRRLKAGSADTTAVDLALETAKREKAEAETRLAEFKAQAAIAEAARLRQEAEATAAARVAVDKATAEKTDREARVAAEEARLAAAGVPDRVSVATAAALVAPTTRSEPARTATIAGPSGSLVTQGDCAGFAWVFGSLNDQNAYGPSGATRCYNPTALDSFRVENSNSNIGLVLLMNGLLVVAHDHGAPYLVLANNVPREVADAATRAGMPCRVGGICQIPVIPSGSDMYGTSPGLNTTWQFVAFSPLSTGVYDFVRVCDRGEADLRRHRSAWQLLEGDGFKDCR